MVTPRDTGKEYSRSMGDLYRMNVIPFLFHVKFDLIFFSYEILYNMI